MPTYSIKAPNGKTYEIEGPDGATQDEVIAEIMRRDPSAGNPPEASTPDDVVINPKYDRSKNVVPMTSDKSAIVSRSPEQGYFADSIERQGGWGLSDETRKALGANGPIEALRPITDIPANLADLGYRGLQTVQAVTETVAQGLDDLIGSDPLPGNDFTRFMHWDGLRFQPGHGALALIEAFPAGGVETGLARLVGLPSVKTASAGAKPFRLAPEVEAGYGAALKLGSAEDILAYAKENNFTVDEAATRAYVEARDAGKPTNPAVRYAEGEQKLQQEAQDFVANKKPEPTIEDVFPSPEKVKANEDAMAAKLQAEAEAFKTGKKTEAIDETPDLEQAKQYHDKALETADGWQNAPDFEIISSKDTSNPRLAKIMEDENVVAFYDEDGKVRIIQERVKSPDDIPGLVYHEALGHHGLSTLFQKRLDGVMQDMYNTNEAFRAETDAWMEANPGAYPEAPVARAAEEVLAKMSEEGDTFAVSGMDRVKNLVKAFARKAGLKKLAYSNREIKSLLGMAHDSVIKGGKSSVGSTVRYTRKIVDIAEARHAKAQQDNSFKTPYKPTPSLDEIENMIAEQERRDLDNRSSIVKEIRDRSAAQEKIQGHKNPSNNNNTSLIKYSRRPMEGTAGNINLENLSSTKDISRLLEETSKGIDKTTVTHEEIKNLADDLGLTPSRLIKGSLHLTPEKALAARQVLVRSAERVLDLSKKVITNGSFADEANLAQALATHAAVQERVSAMTAEAGRVLNSFKIAAARSSEAGDLIKFMAERTGNDLFKKPENVKQIAKMLTENADNPKAVNRIAKDVFKPKAEDYIFSVWYNMLLSAPPTHTANFVGTMLNFGMDLVEHAGASLIGQVKRLNPEAERVMAREVLARIYGATKALVDGDTWKNTGKSFMTGETGNVPNAKSGESFHLVMPGALKVLETPTRSLAAADEWWRNVIQLSNLYGLAVRKAGKEGLTGQSMWSRVNELVENPTSEMYEATADYSKVLQFLDKPSPLAEMIMKGHIRSPKDTIPTRIVRSGIRVVLPFIRTPDALIRTAVRRAGPLGLIEREFGKGWEKKGAARDVVISRMALGSGLAAYIAMKTMDGEITGSGPSDPKKKQEWLATHQENSIKIGDTWYSYAGLEPISINFAAVSSLTEKYMNEEESDESFAEKSAEAVYNVGTVLNDNAYTSTIGDFFQMTSGSDDQRKAAFSNFMAGIASSVTTPAIVRKYTQTYDDTAKRDTRGDGSLGDRVEGRIKSGWPGESNELPQRHDVYGRPMEREGYTGPDALSRSETKKEETDPTIKELQRLGEVSSKPVVGAPGTRIGDRKLTAEEFQEYQRLSGTWIVEDVKQEMSDPSWNDLTDDEKIEIIKDIVKSARKDARDELFNTEEEDQ